jgi:hypothetical protein
MNDVPQKSWTVAETKDGGWVKLSPKFYGEEYFPKEGAELTLASPRVDSSA